MAICMQGTGLPKIDLGAATMKMNEDGSFNLLVGATDIGTGSDTILAQIAAETLGIDTGDIIVTSSDTDTTPFDVGAYASSTTYVSGGAVKRCAEAVREQIAQAAGEILGVSSEELIPEEEKPSPLARWPSIPSTGAPCGRSGPLRALPGRFPPLPLRHSLRISLWIVTPGESRCIISSPPSTAASPSIPPLRRGRWKGRFSTPWGMPCTRNIGSTKREA